MKNFITKIGVVLVASAAVLVLSGCGEDSGTSSEVENETSPNVNMGSMVDSRDGQAYKTVQIGKQTWMAENLSYQTSESMCYEDKPENCEKYGHLYDWNEAVTVCPEGWHLPNKQELEDLRTLAGKKAGDIDMAGTALKSTTGWSEYDGKSGNGTDGIGFGALPAGAYSSSYDYFYNEGREAYFWSSTERSSISAYYQHLYYDDEYARVGNYDKSYRFSVRCVKNL